MSSPGIQSSAFVYKPRSIPAEVSPSPQQAAIYDWVKHGSGSLLVEAGAGTGKTTLLLGSLRRLTGTVHLAAYNKAIAVELRAKADAALLSNSQTRIGTMHSAGFGACRRVWSGAKVDDRKSFLIAKAAGVPESCMTFVTKLVSFAKQFLIGVKTELTDQRKWMELVDTFSLEEELSENDLSYAVSLAIKVLQESRVTNHQMIDFDDMIYAPLDRNLTVYQNDWLLLDEVQDSSMARIALALRMLRPGGRFIGVGDSTQCIFGFTGAMNDAMLQVKQAFNCTTMPLTVTYRCPKRVVQYANEWMPKLEAAPNAPDGIKRFADTKCIICRGTGKKLSIQKNDNAPNCPACKGQATRPWYLVERITAKDAILCRYTRPLIATAYGLLRSGIACKVEGRDLGKGLERLARRWRIKSLNQLEERLTLFEARTVEKYEKLGRASKADETKDQISTLRLIIEGVKERGGTLIDDLIKEIETLFADNVKGQITLCTGHRSKGREWPRVYIMLKSARRSSRDWENEQENNIRGVMATRSLYELVLVPEDAETTNMKAG